MTTDTIIITLATIGVAFLGGLAGWILSIQTRTARLETAVEALMKPGGPIEHGEKGYGISVRVGREVEEMKERVRAMEQESADRGRLYGALTERLENFGGLLQEVRVDVKELLKSRGGDHAGEKGMDRRGAEGDRGR